MLNKVIILWIPLCAWLTDWMTAEPQRAGQQRVLEHNCSFHTDLFISRLWAGNILVLQVLHGPELSLGARSWLTENMKTVLPAFTFKSNAVRCCPLVARIEILHFFILFLIYKIKYYVFKNKIYIIINNKQKPVFNRQAELSRTAANPSLPAVMLNDHILQDHLMKALRQTRSYFR